MNLSMTTILVDTVWSVLKGSEKRLEEEEIVGII